MRRVCALKPVLVAVLGLTACVERLAAAPADEGPTRGTIGSRGELAMLRRLPPELLARLRGGRADARGYVGYQQTRTEFTAAHQRGGTYTLAMGVVLRRPEWIDEGWRVIDATFDHRNSDGSLGDPIPDQASSVAFFLCFCARALGLLQASEYADDHGRHLKAVLPKVQRACRWLTTQTAALDKANAHAPNRCFIIANAFALSNALTPDAEAKRLGTRYLDLGLKSFRASDGVFVERGGGDSSYQAVSIMVLLYYRLHVAEPRLDDILRKAVDWELNKVRDSGEIDVEGNTRTGLKQEKWGGHYKDVNVPEVIQALANYGLWRPNDRALDAAKRIAQHYYSAKPKTE